jgi:heterotetrameric sarcosine oxidase gamma subunit
MADTTVKTASAETKPRLTLRLPEAPAILHVLASRSTRDSVAGKLGKLAAAGRFVLRAAGPDKWLVLAPAAEAPRLMTELRKALAETASLLDQSDGRVLIELSGSEAREALAQGTGIDLDRHRIVDAVADKRAPRELRVLSGQPLVDVRMQRFSHLPPPFQRFKKWRRQPCGRLPLPKNSINHVVSDRLILMREIEAFVDLETPREVRGRSLRSL